MPLAPPTRAVTASWQVTPHACTDPAFSHWRYPEASATVCLKFQVAREQGDTVTASGCTPVCWKPCGRIPSFPARSKSFPVLTPFHDQYALRGVALVRRKVHPSGSQLRWTVFAVTVLLCVYHLLAFSRSVTSSKHATVVHDDDCGFIIGLKTLVACAPCHLRRGLPAILCLADRFFSFSHPGSRGAERTSLVKCCPQCRLHYRLDSPTVN
jgi:hypothetical protein